MWLGFCSYLFVALVLTFTLAQLFFSFCGFLQQDITMTHPIWFELIKGMPAAFVTLGIGLLATYVAGHQYKVAKAKLKLDLFEKRLEIYNITNDFLLEILNPNLSYGDLNAFSNKVNKANFLFGVDIRGYLDIVQKSAAQIHAIHVRSKANHNLMLQQDIQAHTDLSQWALDQRLGGLSDAFEKYLSFDAWH